MLRRAGPGTGQGESDPGRRMVSPAVGQTNQGPSYKPQVGSQLGPKTPRTCGREAAEGMKAAAR